MIFINHHLFSRILWFDAFSSCLCSTLCLACLSLLFTPSFPLPIHSPNFPIAAHLSEEVQISLSLSEYSHMVFITCIPLLSGSKTAPPALEVLLKTLPLLWPGVTLKTQARLAALKVCFNTLLLFTVLSYIRFFCCTFCILPFTFSSLLAH